MKRIYFCISVLMLSSIFSFAQTSVSGGLYANANWTKVNSPYLVTDNYVIFQGVTLTIEPGTVVQISDDKGIELRGKMIAIGTSMDSITFTSASTSPSIGKWNGITVVGTTNPLGVGNQLTMEYVNGLYAKKFVNLDLAYHGPYIFNHCYFAYNYAVNEDGGMPETRFDNCVFESNHL